MHTYLIDIFDVPNAEEAAELYWGEFPMITVKGDNIHLTLDIDVGNPCPDVKFFADLYSVSEEQVRMRVLKRF